MQPRPPYPAPLAADPLGSIDPSALHAFVAATRDPWLASLFARRLTTLRERLGELRAWLMSLPRRVRRAWGRRWAMALPAAALVMALAGGPAHANTITVDVGAGGNCSLAEAIGNANNNITGQPNADCGMGTVSGADMINFANANGTYLLSTNYGGSPLPAITSPITIQGNGNTTLDAEFDFSVLRVTSGGSLGLSNATITRGFALSGGGIFVSGATLSVDSATISGNSASDNGGGIFAESGSTVNLTDATTISSNNAFDNGGGIAALNSSVSLQGATISLNLAGDGGAGIYAYASTVTGTSATISGNRSSASGGGIYATSASTVNLQGTTISGNTANDRGGGIYANSASMVSLQDGTITGNTSGRQGGGIFALIGTVDLTSSTASGNSADSSGGGIYVFGGTANLTNATISGNESGFKGGGIYASSTRMNLVHVTVTGNSAQVGGGGIISTTASIVGSQSSIVAGQVAGADCAVEGMATLTSGGHNIESATSCGFTGIGDQQNVTAAQLNLGPLAPNPPGTTQTHALGPGSFALDKIPSATNGCGTTITDDQRGISRPQPTGGQCDVGAFELEQASPTPTPGAPTAAQVTRFAAAPDPTGRIRITWETASEVDVVGFRVQRSEQEGGRWNTVGGLIPARGSATGGASYTATDTPGVGAFRYRLEVVEMAGAPRTYGPVEAIVRTLRAFLPVGWRGR